MVIPGRDRRVNETVLRRFRVAHRVGDRQLRLRRAVRERIEHPPEQWVVGGELHLARMAVAEPDEAVLVDAVIVVALVLRIDGKLQGLEIVLGKSQRGERIPHRLRVRLAVRERVGVRRIDAGQRQRNARRVRLQVQNALSGHANGVHRFHIVFLSANVRLPSLIGPLRAASRRPQTERACRSSK